MFKKILTFCIIFICYSTIITSQIKNFNTENGLISNTVYSFNTLKNGIIIATTENGLIKYDGQNFYPYTVENEEILEKISFNAYEDKLGRIWLYTFSGKPAYIYKNKVYNEKNTPVLKKDIERPIIRQVQQLEDSSIIFYLIYAPYYYKYKNNMLQKIDFSKIVNGRSVVTINFLENGVLEVYLINEILYLNKDLRLIKQIKYKNIWSMYTHNLQFTISVQKDSFIINNFTFPLPKNLNISNISNFNYHNNKYYITTYNGFFECDCLNKTVKNYFDSLVITDIEFCKNNTALIGTKNKGLFVYKINSIDTNKSKVVNEQVYNCAINKDNICLIKSPSQQIEVLNTNNFKTILKLNSNNKISENVSQNNCLSNNSNLLILKDSTLLITKGNKLISNQKIEFNHYYKFAILDKQNNIYTCNSWQLFKYNFKAKLSKQIIQNDRIFSIINTNFNETYFAGIKGIYKLQNDSAINIYKNLLCYDLNSLNNYVYLKTYDNNSFLIKKLENQFSKIYEIKNNPNNLIQKSFQLNDSTMVLYGTQYHKLIALQNSKISITDLPFEFFESTPIAIKSLNQKLVVCYTNKISELDYDILFKDRLAPEMSNFIFYTDKKIYTDINQESSLTTRFLKIKFDVINYDKMPFTVQYSYNQQSNIVNNKEIIINNLEFGDNIITINLLNTNGGIYQTKKIKITIKTPFYKNPIFYLLAFLFTVFLIWLLYFNYFKMKSKREKKIFDLNFKLLKSEFIAMNSMMNPHFIFNSLSNIKFLYEQNMKIDANKYLDIFSTLIRKNMNSVNSELVSLEDELEIVEKYLVLNKLRYANTFDYIINIDASLDVYDYETPPLLIQPIVENSLVHGLFKKSNIAVNLIVLDVYKQYNQLIIAIKDNGIDFNINERFHQKTGSIALSNIKNRIEYQNNIKGQNIKIEYSKNEDFFICTLSFTIN